MRILILMSLPVGTMQEGLSVREELLVLLMALVEFEMTDVLESVVGMVAPDARKAVRIWKVMNFRTVFNLFMMIFT